MSIHKLNQSSLPVILIGAGLSQILGLAGTSKSHAECLFKFPEIGALDEKDAVNAIVNPAREEGVTFDKAAVQILSLTERHPYFSNNGRKSLIQRPKCWKATRAKANNAMAKDPINSSRVSLSTAFGPNHC
jgi:hypothetical protein